VQAGAPSRRVSVVLTVRIEAYRPAPGSVRIPITHMRPVAVIYDMLGGSSLNSPVTVVAIRPLRRPVLPLREAAPAGRLRCQPTPAAETGADHPRKNISCSPPGGNLPVMMTMRAKDFA